MKGSTTYMDGMEASFICYKSVQDPKHNAEPALRFILIDTEGKHALPFVVAEKLKDEIPVGSSRTSQPTRHTPT